jgi:hypothetical protein
VEETDNSILLRPVKPVLFPKTTLQQAAGCLQSAYVGKPKTLEEMEAAIQQGFLLLLGMENVQSCGRFATFDDKLVKRAKGKGSCKAFTP